MDFGRSMHYFKGAREHRPPGGLKNTLINMSLATSLLDIGKLYRSRSDAAKHGICSGSPLTGTVCLQKVLLKFECK